MQAIFKATADCREAFRFCQGIEVLSAGGAWAQCRQADFNLWASAVGASARPRASLDARLVSRPDAQTIIANLLWLLCDAVTSCIELGKYFIELLPTERLFDL